MALVNRFSNGRPADSQVSCLVRNFLQRVPLAVDFDRMPLEVNTNNGYLAVLLLFHISPVPCTCLEVFLSLASM